MVCGDIIWIVEEYICIRIGLGDGDGGGGGRGAEGYEGGLV